MNFRHFIFRTLLHYRVLNLALVAAIALAATVLTGSLMVGDSVRGSLRDIALQRLGPYDHALVTSGLFEESLANRLNALPDFRKNFDATAALAVRGRAVTESPALAVANVQVYGFPARSGPFDFAPAGRNSAYANVPVVDALAISAEKSVLVTIPTFGEIPADAALARRSRADVLSSVRVRALPVPPNQPFLQQFSLAPSQRQPRNMWLRLDELQTAIDQPKRANMLLVRGSPAVDPSPFLKSALQLEDFQLTLEAVPGSPLQQVTSRSTYLRPAVLSALQKISPDSQLFATNLLTQVENASSPTPATTQARTAPLHYVIATATNAALASGERPLREGEVVLNQWAADNLCAKPGDAIRFTYLKRADDGKLVEHVSPTTFTVMRILPMSGLGADRTLTPDYPGLTDTDSVADWSPPEGFPFDKKLVTPADEAYWKEFRAAPKMFFSLSAAQLWETPVGVVTSARFRRPDGQETAARQLASQIEPADFGFVFQPIREQQLRAASGSTDFSGLFIGFSFFLIVSALLLLALLAKLAVEQRLPQLGLMSALGITPRRITWLLFAEFASLSVIGAVIGAIAGVGYTALLLHLLITWWLPAVGTTALTLHVVPGTLVTGGVLSLVVSALTLFFSIRRYARGTPVSLLSGRTNPSSRRIRLAALLSKLRLLPARNSRLTTMALVFRNITSKPTRSALIAGLIASASFILILVASMKQLPPSDPSAVPSGTGGFRLILTADISLLGDLNSAEGRRLLGMRSPDDPLLQRARFSSLRSWQGQDISCLNMTRPTQPTLVGIPPAVRERFAMGPSLPHSAAASSPAPSSHARAWVNADTLTYILQSNLGDSLHMIDQRGEAITLTYFQTLQESALQSELLIDSADFDRFFPLQRGYSLILIECSSEDALPLQRLLESELDEFSVTVEPTTARLARYKEVANTYLATFQTLGAMGLLLGTVGLAIILLRSTLERRSELALLLALGFTRRFVARMLLLENTLLLSGGLLAGTILAMAVVIPSGRPVNLLSLAISFGLIFAAGLASLLLALPAATRSLTPASLRNG